MAVRKRKPRNHPRLSLTRELVDEAAEIVGKGMHRYVARGQLGVPEGTWKSWLARGRKELREYQSKKRKLLSLKAELVMALDKAECDAHHQFIEELGKSDNLKLKMEYLYKRYSKLYHRSYDAIDDETGDEYKVDPLEMLAEKLSRFMQEE